MPLRRVARAIPFAASALLCACAPLSTRVDPPDGSADGTAPKIDGLTYFLPLQDVVVTLAVDHKAKLPRAITLGTTGVYADRSHRFVANYRANQAGTNALSIKIDANGLLNGDTTSTLTPKISDVLSALASDFGNFAGNRVQDRVPTFVADGTTPCDRDDTYVWIVPLAATGNASQSDRDAYQAATDSLRSCKITFDATPLFATIDPAPGPKALSDGDGLYYRQAVPYRLKITDELSRVAQNHFLALPTHDAPTEFLPVQHSLFAASTFGATFAAGTPTAYSQSADSEWLGVVSIPAAVLKSYVGAVTDAFKDKEGLDTERLKALVAEQKLAACVAAVRSGVKANQDAACQ